MTTPLMTPVRCLRVGTKRAWHLPRIVLAGDEKAWELHTWCGLDLTGVEHTDTHQVPTCQICVTTSDAFTARTTRTKDQP